MAETGTDPAVRLSLRQLTALVLCLILAGLWYAPLIGLRAYGYTVQRSLSALWAEAGLPRVAPVAVVVNLAGVLGLIIAMARRGRRTGYLLPMAAALWNLLWFLVTLLVVDDAVETYGNAASRRLTAAGWLYTLLAAVLPLLLISADRAGRRMRKQAAEAAKQSVPAAEARVPARTAPPEPEAERAWDPEDDPFSRPRTWEAWAERNRPKPKGDWTELREPYRRPPKK